VSDTPNTNHSPAIRGLDAQLGVLGIAVAQWAIRDDSKPQPQIRQAGSMALAAIDDMSATLHRLRGQLASEIRQADDANAARVDAMLAEAKAERDGRST
jgi:hypothetical protein